MLVSDQSIRHIALDRRVGEHPTSIPITEPLTAIILYPDLLKKLPCAVRCLIGIVSDSSPRSTLRSWCADHAVEFEVSEAILAHSSSAVVAAYQRSSLVERRRPVTSAWASYLSGEEPATADVIPLRRSDPDRDQPSRL
jgi:hypothetical protein